MLWIAGCSGPDPQASLASAQQYLQRGEPRGALVELRNVLAAQPQSAPARFLMGRTLLVAGDAVGAEVELRKARELGHPQAEVLPVLLEAMLRQGAYRKLVEEFGASTPSEPELIAATKVALASAWMSLGKPDEAEAALATALQVAPDDAGALVLQVRLLAARGQAGEAAARSEALVQRFDSNGDAWKLRGEVLRRVKNDAPGALAAFRRALELNPLDLEAHAQAVSLLVAQDDRPGWHAQLDKLRAVAPGHPMTRYFEALKAYQAKDDKAAREHLAAVFKQAPDHLQALELAGFVEVRQGSLVQAETYLGKAIALAPQNRATRRLLADVQMRRGRTAEAIATLKPALAALPDAATLAAMGRAQLMAGDAAAARESFARAVKLNPRDTGTRVALAAGDLQLGRADVAFKALEELSQADDGATAALALAAARLSRREFAEALKVVEQIEQKTPGQAHVAELRGRIQLLQGDTRAARASFEQALSRDAKFYPAHANLVTVDLAENRPDDAVQRLQKLVAEDPSLVQAWLTLAKLQERRGTAAEDVVKTLRQALAADPRSAPAHLQLVEHHLRSGQDKAALAAAEAGVAAVPDSPVLQEALGRAQLASGSPNQALKTFNQVIAQQPQAPGLHLRAAEAHLATRNVDDARRSLQRALAVKPDYLAAQELLVRVETANGRHPEALAVARQVQRQRPKQAVGFLLEGDVQSVAGRHDAALAAYRQALGVESSTVSAEKVHVALTRLRRGGEADTFAQRWTRDHPADARFRQYLGDHALLRGDLPAAEARYREVLAIAPDNPLALNNLASVMVKLQKPGALPLAEKAARLSPRMHAITDTLAMAQAAEGQLDQAIRTQSQLVQAQPRQALYRLNLARIYLQAGRKDDARRELNQLKSLGREFDGQQEVERLLQTLG